MSFNFDTTGYNYFSPQISEPDPNQIHRLSEEEFILKMQQTPETSKLQGQKVLRL